MRKLCLSTLVVLLTMPQFSHAQEVLPRNNDDSVEVLILPEIHTNNSEVLVNTALDSSNPEYEIFFAVAPDIYVANVHSEDIATLQSNPTIVVQKNQQRFLMASSADILMHVGVDILQAAPYNAMGSGYATAIIDTGVRATHNFFTVTGGAYDVDTNPSRVLIEHCQSAGQAITNTDGSYILDGSGNKLYEGISTCNGNVSVPTAIDATTYYSNTVPGTTTSSFGASAPCNAEYPGFTSGCRHGSHVAGIAAGTAANYSGTDYSGIAPGSGIISFNVFTKYTDPGVCGGSAPCFSATDADIIAALSQIEELAVAGTRIGSVNMSLGGGSYTDELTCKNDNLIYYYAFERLKSYGIPVVVAAGNSAFKDKISAPGCVPNAYSVGATTVSSPGDDEVASYSNIASFLDFLAPGTALVSADSDDEAAFFSASGTSMAAPVVAGAFTLLRSMFDGTHAPYPLRSVDAISDALKSTATTLDDTRVGGVATALPRINVAAAAARLANKPYITLPNKSALSIAYPLSYRFSVSSNVDIDPTAITATGSTTATVGLPDCTAISSSSYDCTVIITSPGNLQLSVTDTGVETYITPVIELSSVPAVASISTTATSGTYGVGASIPITVTLSGTDSFVRKNSLATIQLNNTALVSVAAPDSTSNTLTGVYIIGDSASGQDISKLAATGFSNVALDEYDGTHYAGVAFASAVGTNLDQGGKIIAVQVTPTPPPPVVVSSGGGGGGGGGSSVPVALSESDKLLFCSSVLATELSEGSSGKNVLMAETILQQLGLFKSLPNLDYNSATSLAVKSLQEKYSPSRISGSIDLQTWEIMKFASGCSKNSPKRTISEKIKKLELAESAQQGIPSFKKIVRVGTSSPLVSYVYARMVQLGHVPRPKSMPRKLTKSVSNEIRRFQKAHGLTATGSIDRLTYDFLINN